MTILATFLVASYVFISLIINVPNKTVTAPFKAIESAARPYFGQSWRVFAPSIMKTNVSLEFQAQWRDESGKLVHSKWVNLTEIEQRSVSGHFTPSRINKSSWNAVQAYLKRYNNLNAKQKKIVQDTFIQKNKDGTFSAKSGKTLRANLGKHGTNTGQITSLLSYDLALVQYTGTSATAYFDKKIERVRWRVQRSRPNDFNHRFSDTNQFKDSVTTFGWRHFEHQVTPDELTVHRDALKRYGAMK
ncbi:DUF5819 family protein [Jonesiaceae bacterium BS-20]|uniref:DUF5819 family protein n=1 Tax=Jonesiaceae bacterium BS-20 TaxID=3120821 RepID=A0AAU7DXA4_9MICO